jgi:putative transposase
VEKFSKTLRRTATLEGLANRFGRESLREIVEAYTSMLQEMLGYALEHNESQSTLHRIFYNRFREISMASYEGFQGML